jgi:hypothetical protein
MVERQSERILAAKVARELIASKISYKQFLDDYPDDDETNDDEIHKLFSLIEHQPKVGGLFGINKVKHEQYMSQILKLIKALEATK